MSVLRLSILVLSLSLISGCAVLDIFGKKPPEIVVKTKAEEKTRLSLPDPTPLKARDIEWVIITPQNSDEVWKSLEEDKVDKVLFSLTDDDYQELAMIIAELRNFVAQQRLIILKYKEYYEPPKKE